MNMFVLLHYSGLDLTLGTFGIMWNCSDGQLAEGEGLDDVG